MRGTVIAGMVISRDLQPEHWGGSHVETEAGYALTEEAQVSPEVP